jgi:hypothetical protein
MIPRIGSFRTKTAVNHMVMVDGDKIKSLCTRMPLVNGAMTTPDSTINCDSCVSRSWTRRIAFGRPVVKDENGKILDWEAIEARSK